MTTCVRVPICLIACVALAAVGCATRTQLEPARSSQGVDSPAVAASNAAEPAQPMALACSKPIFDIVVFEFNKTDLTPKGMAVINELVAALKEQRDVTVVIHSHTCDLGPAQANLELAQRRADAVKRYMVENRINGKRLTINSCGESDPALPNDSEANRRLNRRVEFETTFPFVGEWGAGALNRREAHQGRWRQRWGMVASAGKIGRD
ncbi:MAG: OmpA family protein [Candidatus Hydrogenedentes bacterium]|nr:OmpA family protein [Candidatus Hydrogenedentota bacterium]